MSAADRARRLQRIARALDQLREAEALKLQRAQGEVARLTDDMREIEAIDPVSSVTWQNFPDTWFGFRVRLEAERGARAADAEVASRAKQRFEKIGERFAERLDALMRQQQAADDGEQASEFVARDTARGATGLGKLSGLGLGPSKRRS